MLIYIIVYLTIVLFASLKNLQNENKLLPYSALVIERLSIIGPFILIVFLLGFRHQSMGHDLRYLSNNGYLAWFERIAVLSWKDAVTKPIANYEVGFVVFNKTVSLIWNSRQFYLFSVAFFSILPIYLLIKNRSPFPTVSYLIYLGLPVFLLEYSGLRQSLAIAITVFSIRYIEELKITSFIKFVLCVILATLFHSSAWIFVFAYPVFHINFSKKGRLISVAFLIVVFLFKVQLFETFARFFKEDAEMYQTNSITLYIVFTLVYVLCSLFSGKGRVINGYINIFYLACIFQSFSGIHNLAMRIGYYFMIYLVIILPQMVDNIKDKKDRLIVLSVIVVCFVVYGLFSIFKSTWACAAPYHFFWESV